LRKRDDGDATTIDVVPMQAEADRLAEIARMLSGEITGISLEHAATLVASTRAR
jgi:DNA repair ATPase RecN